MSKNVLAIDFGASSGRAVAGMFDGERLSLHECRRFDNEPVSFGGDFYWDFPRLFHEVGASLRAAHAAGGFDSVGLDTWGVDFGLLDARGRLMSNLYHYRDARNAAAARRVLADHPMPELYARTGIQFAPFNSIFQLRAVRDEQPWLLEHAERLLMLPDLFNFFLSGVQHTEYSAASTSGALDVRARAWDETLLSALGVPVRLFQTPSLPGQALGPLLPSLCEEWMLPPVPVLSVAAHDTASAVAAVPAGPDAAYLSCGTWSLLGTQLDEPNTSPAALEANFTNEGACSGKIRFLKNIMGLWLIQESRRHWARTGQRLSYAELEAAARPCPAFRSFIDVDNPAFAPPGNLPARVRETCARTGQPVPESVGEIMQCIYGSIALAYRRGFEQLEALSGRRFGALHIVGGGIKDRYLCQLTADILGIPVIAGPAEATAIGNLAVQLVTLGELSGLDDVRRLVQDSFPTETFEPAGSGVDDVYARYRIFLEQNQ